jgi:hypothetical protein
MNLSIRHLLLFIIVFSQICWAKDQVVILLFPVENDLSVGSVEQLLPEKHHNSQLVGRVRKSHTSDQKEYLFQIAWTGLQDKTDKTKQVAFEKPMVSTFKTLQKSLKKGQSLPLVGDLDHLLKAAQQLEIEQTDVQALKRKQFAKNPSAKGRSVEIDTPMDLHIHALADNTQNRVNAPPPSQEGIIPQNALTKDTGLQMIQDFNNATFDVKASQKSSGSGLNRGSTSSFTSNAEVQGIQQGISGAPYLNGNVHQSNARGNAVPLVRNRAAQANAGLAHLGRGGFNPPNANGDLLGDNALAFDAAPERIAEIEAPEITYGSTTEGCQPTIDRPHERVVIQNRTLKRENGAIVEEGACADSLEMYPINKDFLCEGCTDQVELPRQRAYARFKEYWLDKENQRQNLSDTLYVELTRPYVFSEESGYCLPSVNLQRGTAQRQVETVYYNLFNARTVVEACHTTPNHAPVLINQTTHLCPMVHDFANNVSREQKRSIFTLDGIEREALACHPNDPTFPHEFVRTGCRPLVSAVNGTFIDMVKRKIRTPTGNKIISEECEPAVDNALLATREGCEGEFFHDLIAGFSYLKKRYYYPHAAGREYMTGCLRTTESLAHQTESNGYQHDDQNLHSTPKFLLYIDSPEQGRLIVDPAKVIAALGQTNYTLLRNEHRPTAEQYYEGCYRRTRTQSINIYTRTDGTLYERIIGTGNPIGSPVDECTRSTESKQVVIGHGGGRWYRHGRAQYGTQHRTKITYPNGTVEYTAWQ